MSNSKKKKKRKRKSHHLVPKAFVDSSRIEAIVFRHDPNRVILSDSEGREVKQLVDLQPVLESEEQVFIKPPLNAEFPFHLFLDAKNCDALVGDLEERYRSLYQKFGARRANFWYWVQVVRSVGPIAWAATKKLLKAVSGVAALVEMYRRLRS